MIKEVQNLCKIELRWPGKDDWDKSDPKLLLEKSTYGIINEDEENLLIHGDNLPSLKALEKDYTGKVKCVYIDPPYNTKGRFIHYDDSMEHSMWLNMMKERLIILRRLLREDGSIWISIDDSECHYLKVMCDEIFGRKNFTSNIIWQKKNSSHQKSNYLANVHDYILVYVKNSEKWRPKLLPRTKEMDDKYKNPDQDPRGPWMADNLTVGKTKNQRPNQYYAITDPKTGNKFWPNENRVWSYIPETIAKHIQEKRIIFSKNFNKKPAFKRFLNELQEGILPKTLWLIEECGSNSEAKKEALSFNRNDVFLTPKPERLIKRIIEISSEPGDLVLDCFAGSGTTGAVAQKMRRRWIMIEMNDHCQTHILPRLQKVIDGTDKGGITTAVNWKGGGGFRYFELA